MPKLLQINAVANQGSTGKITEQIGRLAQINGWESKVAFGRGNFCNSQLSNIRIGSDFDVNWHGIETRIFDNHGLASRRATKKFIEWAKIYNPDIVHLHNIHGYYLNYPLLFNWIKKWGGPVVWTLHDCWPLTGHCTHFMTSKCEKWKSVCSHCPSIKDYPISYIDHSKRNFEKKRKAFNSIIENLTLVPVSYFVNGYLKDSILKDAKRIVIHNGIDIEVFKPSSEKKPMILGVANVWNEHKGLNDFFLLRNIIDSDIGITLVGLTEKQIKALPNGIEGITRTNNQDELAKLYSSAIALVNPTYEDNYPTVNLEAIACGTPVFTYNTGGSPESISSETGEVILQGDIQGIANAIRLAMNGHYSQKRCREYAVANFDQRICFEHYINLYNSLLQ